MAIMVPGPLVSAVSGRVGGVTFAVGRGGHTIKRTGIVMARRSAAALAVKARVARLGLAWAALTSDQRKAWNAFGARIPSTSRLGVRRQMTGYQTFAWCNWGFTAGTGGVEAYFLEDPPPTLRWGYTSFEMLKGEPVDDWIVEGVMEGFEATAASFAVGLVKGGYCRQHVVIANGFFNSIGFLDLYPGAQAFFGEWPAGVGVEWEYRTWSAQGIPSPPFRWRTEWQANGAIRWRDGSEIFSNTFPPIG